MKGYLVAEEGPLAGTTLSFEEGIEDNEWVLGRDPDAVDIALEDPMVSRRHVIIRATPDGFVLENLSTVNPATQNGMLIEDPVLLKEGDIIQIGSTFFNFTEKAPEEESSFAPSTPEVKKHEQKGEIASEIHFGPHPDTRWLLKVISGPNAGAEFALHRNASYIIGKDPNTCDVVFQDLSVSKEHARLTLDEGDNIFIEDLKSRNGVIVNGELIDEKHLLTSQDLIALGTTTFLVVDRMQARETIISPPAVMPTYRKEEAKVAAKESKWDWKEMMIPKRHLVVAGLLGVLLLSGLVGMLSLFKAEPVVVVQVDENEKVKKALEHFPGVMFSFNRPSGNLFLTGHVLTTVNHQELMYAIKELPFVSKVEDNVIVDELVWQNMNALFSREPQWAGISMYASEAGKFVLRGYVETLEQAVALNDYINLNFNYLDLLSNQVVVEKNLQSEIQSMLLGHNLSGVSFELLNGDLVLTGRVGKKQHQTLQELVHDLRHVPGIREVKSYVVVTTEDSSRIDLTKAFKVTGYSKRDEMDYYVVINGKILGQGDLLEGMLITKISPKLVLLEKEGQKYKIDYNLQ